MTIEIPRSSVEAPLSLGEKLRVIAFLGTGAVALSAMAYVGYQELFNRETQVTGRQAVTAGPGESVWGIAQDHIDGANNFDPRFLVDLVTDDPRNAEVLEDGLQVGEVVIVPEAITRE